MSRGKTKRLAWTGSHNKYKKYNAIYKEAYEKIFGTISEKKHIYKYENKKTNQTRT